MPDEIQLGPTSTKETEKREAEHAAAVASAQAAQAAATPPPSTPEAVEEQRAAEVMPEAEPKQGKLPEDFPGHTALAEANITTFAQARKQRDSEEGLTAIDGIGPAMAKKIEEALDPGVTEGPGK